MVLSVTRGPFDLAGKHRRTDKGRTGLDRSTPSAGMSGGVVPVCEEIVSLGIFIGLLFVAIGSHFWLPFGKIFQSAPNYFHYIFLLFAPSRAKASWKNPETVPNRSISCHFIRNGRLWARRLSWCNRFRAILSCRFII